MVKVIPGLCREAIESACYEIIRARRLSRGDSHVSVEDAITEPTTLVSRLALAIFDDAGRGGEVYTWLNRNAGSWATTRCRPATRAPTARPDSTEAPWLETPGSWLNSSGAS